MFLVCTILSQIWNYLAAQSESIIGSAHVMHIFGTKIWLNVNFYSIRDSISEFPPESKVVPAEGFESVTTTYKNIREEEQAIDNAPAHASGKTSYPVIDALRSTPYVEKNRNLSRYSSRQWKHIAEKHVAQGFNGPRGYPIYCPAY